MGSAMWVGLSGAVARMRELDVVSNNLANADTVGFKRHQLAFQVALQTAVSDLGVGPAAGAPGRVFTGHEPGGPNLAAGPVQLTGAPLDVAIDGEGFFEIATPAGPRYTRAGSFAVSPQRLLVTQSGEPVLGEGGPISVGDGPLRIDAAGQVVAGLGDVQGRLKVVRFDDPRALEADGRNAFRIAANAGGAAPAPVVEARFVERSLERSNVQAVEELASLVFLQRAFELSMRAVQSDDESTQRLIQELS